MSTYNETVNELEKSINSILNQTYKNIEFIIISDNPQNYKNIDYLDSLTDVRIRIIKNKTNIGLVASLNEALNLATGEYVARMDADDISYLNRLVTQIVYIKSRDLDVVGGNVEFIDESDEIISQQHFPSEHSKINYFLKWGNCVPHPTWLVKKNVYLSLNGYRNIPRCEDYDFICRAIQNGFKIGNVREYVLKYRIRENSVSNSKKGEQYLVRDYIARNRGKNPSEKEVEDYIKSDSFKKELELYEEFQCQKQRLRDKKDIYDFIRLIINKYTYCLALEKIGLKFRNIVSN